MLGSDPLENLVSNGRDVIRLQDHLPQQTEKQIVVALILLVSCYTGALIMGGKVLVRIEAF